MERLVESLAGLPPNLVYAAVAFATLIENFFPPTPSDFAVALGGFLTQHGIAVGMAGESMGVGHEVAAEAQGPARGEAVGVVADPDADAHAFRMRIARCAAFFALSMPTVATGTPLGTCTVA